VPSEQHPSTLTSDLLPSGSPNGHGIRVELRAPATPRQGGPDGSPADDGVGTSVQGESSLSQPAAGAAGAGLENHPDNCSGAGRKWAVLDGLRKITTLDRQRVCMTRPRSSAPVTIGQRGDAAAFGGLLPCGLRTCPNCGPILQSKRRDQIAEVVDAARGMGWTVLFSTLTLGHDAEQGLQEVFDVVFDCWRALTRGGWWNRAKKRHGIRHWVRVIECKEGGAHGWHPHVHLLLFVDPAQGEHSSASSLGQSLNARWVQTVEAAGYRASANAQHLVQATDQHLDTLAAYFTKEMGEELAWEMTDAGGKTARKGTASRSPSELLVAAVSGDDVAVRHWQEFEEVTKGRQLIAWSAGCRTELRLPPAKDASALLDEHAAAVAEETRPLVTVSAEEWQDKASRFGAREALAEVVAAAVMPEEVLWWMRDQGWTTVQIVEERRSAPPRLHLDGPPEAAWLAVPDADGGF
jgi:hypothetical protein